MQISHIDHLVLTVADIPRTVDWYQRVLGMRHVTFAGQRHALTFGRQKLNLHQAGRELEPKAARPAPGSADLCLISATPLIKVQAHLHARRVRIEQGPIARTGATGPITSVYVRDPDNNLIEIATYESVQSDDHEPYPPGAGSHTEEEEQP
jgi:catechol 2,3-dioxygenase-like lactoylglutathione lyase family enzyme